MRTTSRCFALLALAAGAAYAEPPAGSIRVESAWARPTAPGARVGGAFLTLVGGRTADRVVAGSSPAAAAVELHTHVIEDGVAGMRAIPAIDVPAGGRVELKPGGLHVMLIGLKSPLKAGDTVPLRLRFEKAGEVEVGLAVGAPAGPATHGASPH